MKDSSPTLRHNHKVEGVLRFLSRSLERGKKKERADLLLRKSNEQERAS
jgi:hypothetical protein